jgi:HlyD family secretion protein
VLEVHAAPGQFVDLGERIGTVSVGDAASPLEGIVYFTVGDGKRVEVGDRIQVTPDTVERARYGGIEGVVRAVSPLAVTADEVSNLIGNREIAEGLLGGGHRIQVLAELARDAATPSGLKWSSSRGPDEAISAGTTTTARVAVEERRPLGFVLPALRSATGVD